jgi:hypothetical protein
VNVSIIFLDYTVNRARRGEAIFDDFFAGWGG